MKRTLLTSALLLLCTLAFAQSTQQKIQTYLTQNSNELGLDKDQLKSWEITDSHTDEKTKITYVYIRQSRNGVPIYNGLANFAITDETTILSGNRLVKASIQPNATKATLTPAAAVVAACKVLGIANSDEPKAISSKGNEALFVGGTISEEQIPVRLVYAFYQDELRLAWEMNIQPRGESHWWSLRIDALTGEEIDRNDWVAHCDLDGVKFSHAGHQHSNESAESSELLLAPAPPPNTDQYNVYALPVESPNHGGRSLVVGPYNATASPYGWHDTNGSAGAEFTITRGNNVHAMEDANGNNGTGYSPNGGATLNFNFPLNPNQAPVNYRDAAITNLFYMNNVMHDVWYQYGFNEASGNFQSNNYGNGGAAADYVIADAQDGSGMNNANFGTPPDGTSPRMQMYLWNNPGPLLLTVNSPSNIAGGYFAVQATFGPALTTTPITADFVLFTDGTPDVNDACEAATNGASMSGKIVVIRRGSCNFADKVTRAQTEGAVAVIMVNNAAGAPIAMGGAGPGVTIPSVMISQADGNLITAALQSNLIVNGTLVDGPTFDLDGDLDNGIIAHEYGHGISTRLTGGASNSNCLNNSEQMGEGWSDWFGLMLTMQPGDVSTDNRGIGTFVTGESTTGVGIRPAPYNTDFAVNNYTYANTNAGVSVPHGIGFVWCTMLWDMTWAFIDQYGYDPNVYTGTGGNNIAMNLVIQGLKLQPCSPGFVDGRDAILAADQLLYGGANQCLIWNVFANRGLGFSANQGSSNSRSDQTQAFDLPSGIGNVTTSVSESACGSYTWSANGQTYTNSGSFTETVLASTGCDSTITLNLTITGTTSTTTETILNCSAYTWSATGLTYNSSGIYVDTLQNINGCDSIVNLNLTIGTTFATDAVVNCGAYTWIDGNTYTSSNTTATHTLTNSVGCDSIVSLNLTVNPIFAQTEVIGACTDFIWPVTGLTYTSSGIYTANLTSSTGCDSTHMLDLTISTLASSTQNATSCNSYQWALNGTTYSNSGQYIETVTAQSGCDSIVTLNLTITQPTSGTETVSNCESYFWAADGNTYTNSGQYTALLSNTNGCDSTVTLNLTILPATTPVTETVAACDSYVWSANSTNYTASGQFTETLVNSAGCDSVVTLDLTINTSFDGSEQLTVCDSYTWPVDGQTYTASGIYAASFTASTGCDSTHTLDLTIETVDGAASMVDEITLTANTSNATYQWIDCNNNFAPIAGETNQTFDATVNGVYAVIVTTGNCSDTSACLTVDKIGLSEIGVANIHVFPNPNEGMFKIDLGDVLQHVTVKCFNAPGQLMEQRYFESASEIDWNLKAATGVYFFEIEADGIQKTILRVVKN